MIETVWGEAYNGLLTLAHSQSDGSGKFAPTDPALVA